MTNFPPETYLAAANIACQHDTLEWYGEDKDYVLIVSKTEGNRIFDIERYHYRALREALDKKMISIQWMQHKERWIANFTGFSGLSGEALDAVSGLWDEDPTTLMMKIVHALIEAGVLQEADHDTD